MIVVLDTNAITNAFLKPDTIPGRIHPAAGRRWPISYGDHFPPHA